MPAKSAVSKKPAPPRPAKEEAAGRTSKGQQRIADILAAARELFCEGGYGEMTMRQVAERVGMTLSNLQHYFPTREALLKALLDEVVNNYDRAYATLEAAPDDPKAKLDAVLRYLLADIHRQETERLFVEIWSLATRDQTARDVLDYMYVHHRRNLETLIAAAYPSLNAKQVAWRACLVAMQIEGLMLVVSENKPKHRELKGVEEECIRMIHAMLSAE